MIAESEVLREFKVGHLHVPFLLSIICTKEVFGATRLALKALLALPLAIGYAFEHGFQTERVEGFVAFIAIEEESFLSGGGANFTKFAI